MSDLDLVDRLAAHRTLGSAPRKELEWLAAHGELRYHAPGDALARRGDYFPMDLLVVLEGGGGVYFDRGGSPRKVTEWRAGDVTGVLPFSRMNVAIGDAIIDQPTVMLAVHRDHFPELIRECPDVTARLVHTMLDRVRHFASTDWQDDKMMSLGRLAAGLSHELNNPASAAARSAQQLGEALAEVDVAASALAGANLTADQRARIEAVRARVGGGDADGGGATPIERSDREEEICSWLEQHQADARSAAALAETGITLSVLDDLSRSLPPENLDIAVRWIVAGHSARALATDVERATRRIYELVSAVKRFTYMDRPTVAEPSSIAQPIADTITVLAAKARAKSVSVKLDIPADLPRVNVYGGELNQVWSNLLENALDSVGEAGQVIVTARHEHDRVVVRVIDDGPGIPIENLSRIFDPFFTTKPVGHGTGLGLDIARRIVRRHNGHIDVDSRPAGRCTEFRVTLPAL